MCKNFDHISAYLSTFSNQFSAIAISETWLTPETEALFSLDGYQFINKNRIEGRGGGVGMFLKNECNFKIRADLNPTCDSCETIFADIDVPRGKNIVVGVVYRPPKSNLEQFLYYLENLLNKLSKENKQIYILGDYNIDLLKVKSCKVNSVMNIIALNGFYIQINLPTRITSTCASLIDNILTNNCDVIPGILYSPITDHMPIFCYKKGARNFVKSSTFTYRKISDQSINSFKNELNRLDWHDVYESNNVNSAYDIFIKIFKNLYDKHFPIVERKLKRRRRKPWVTNFILKMIKKKNKLYKKFCNSRLRSDERKFKLFRNKVINELRKSRQNYYQEILQHNKNNIKRTWQTINELIGKKKDRFPSSFQDNGEIFTDPVDISNKFNEYFVNIGESFSRKIPRSMKSHQHYCKINHANSLFLSPVDICEVIKVSKSLRSNASSGVDDISNKVVKRVINAIVLPLVHIFNLSFSSGKVPLKLKQSKVVPVFKNNDPAKFTNYRPISLLPCFSKILERLMYNRLYNFFIINKLLNNSQFGFRANHSCEHMLLQVQQKKKSWIHFIVINVL